MQIEILSGQTIDELPETIRNEMAYAALSGEIQEFAKRLRDELKIDFDFVYVFQPKAACEGCKKVHVAAVGHSGRERLEDTGLALVLADAEKRLLGSGEH